GLALPAALRAAFKTPPASLEELRDVHARWAESVVRFAPTGIQGPERQAAQAAAEAARDLTLAAAAARDGVGPPAARVAAHQFADLARDLEGAEQRAAQELARRARALAGSGSYFEAGDLERLVHAPFAAGRADAR